MPSSRTGSSPVSPSIRDHAVRRRRRPEPQVERAPEAIELLFHLARVRLEPRRDAPAREEPLDAPRPGVVGHEREVRRAVERIEQPPEVADSSLYVRLWIQGVAAPRAGPLQLLAQRRDAYLHEPERTRARPGTRIERRLDVDQRQDEEGIDAGGAGLLQHRLRDLLLVRPRAAGHP